MGIINWWLVSLILLRTWILFLVYRQDIPTVLSVFRVNTKLFCFKINLELKNIPDKKMAL
jgi:hypothetical protein